ncbi:hypothetical protein TNCV_1407311 [Trichonephila clavipes]|nr:hypothetical protein TNCV_1407311 [Trichonephila clavipes]
MGPYLLPKLLNGARYLVFLQHVFQELWGHMKLLLYEIPVATEEDLTLWIIFASADIDSTPPWFECVR